MSLDQRRTAREIEDRVRLELLVTVSQRHDPGASVPGHLIWPAHHDTNGHLDRMIGGVARAIGAQDRYRIAVSQLSGSRYRVRPRPDDQHPSVPVNVERASGRHGLFRPRGRRGDEG